MDLAFQAKGKTAAELSELLPKLKALPTAELRVQVQHHLAEIPYPAEMPSVMRPMSWNTAREMLKSGLIDFGGHTHTHPIMARCDTAQQEMEIQTCRARMEAELGCAPRLFAYTNGGPGDFTEETQGLLRKHGFEAAFTMMGGRLTQGLGYQKLPRYGSPETVLEAEAMASGAFELLKKWRGGGR